ncbi:DUF2059 domain-containing protein [Phenylobacterium sp.]|uniref:DUF2059 domain-containing protein n=1 Tax=Phenylobacterium sp. TaxID=1871053 RepID=UPI002BC9646F|nr:DUF2059 domain-containing protein [Phenylobacterium sp.]HLZ76734.1 DUF2059 domain-containing protein [Phenylobacterium sp.]
MKLLVSAVAAAALLSAATFAQAQTAPPPADPVKLSLAHELIEANGGAKQAETSVNAMFAGVSKLFDGMPAEQSKVAKLAQQDLQDEFVKLIPAILDVSANAYAQTLTEKELRDMLAWTNSESGRSIRAKTVQLNQQVIAGELPLIKQAMPKIMRKTIDRACDEAKCTAAQRQQMAALVDKALAPQ